MNQKQVVSRYKREMMLSLVLYIVLLGCSIKFARPMPDSLLRTTMLASPMLGFLGAIWAIARHVRGIDEYQRQFLLETWALAAALTAAFTFSYGFLETAGFPKISMFAVWIIMCGAWATVCLARCVLKR
ncbi:hypothetical protein [Massilia sp. S19_KUP03_FR1]|uniref:hypothetical protein n=1 Tax=Massilia sp. S19_KUP03_FR1 TaxID=3025503 RepID=UPI002FCDBDB4